MNKEQISNRFTAVIFIILLIGFLYLIKSFIISLLLAGIFSGILYPFYKRMVKFFKGRKILSAILVVIIFFLIIVIPSLLVLLLVVEQASELSQTVMPLLEGKNADEIINSIKIPDWMPFQEELRAQKPEIISRLGQIVGRVGNYLVNGLASITQGTLTFFINLFLILYAMFFFLIGGPDIIKLIRSYVPIYSEDFEQLVERAFSVSKATLKGAFVIGIIQGALVGVGFWFFGIKGAAFWAIVAAFMSLIPSIGCAIVWIPGVLYLFFTGDTWQAIVLLAWCAGIVGSIDNVLRPMLVGNDTKMPDLIILVSTLGGIGLFGIMGVIIGPMIAGLLMTSAELYRMTLNPEGEIVEDPPNVDI